MALGGSAGTFAHGTERIDARLDPPGPEPRGRDGRGVPRRDVQARPAGRLGLAPVELRRAHPGTPPLLAPGGQEDPTPPDRGASRRRAAGRAGAEGGRRGAEPPPGDRDAGFTDLVHLAHRVTSQPLLAGNFVEPLRNGEEAYPAMLAAIEGARGFVNLATYIFDGDGAGKEFVLALSAAADRGVEVRVLVDSFGEWYSKVPARRLLRKTRVRTAKFAPPLPLWRGASSIFGATGRSSSSTGRWASRAA